MLSSAEQIAFVQGCKVLTPGKSESCAISLKIESGEIIGTIRPVDGVISTQAQTVEEFTRWRQSATGAFLSEFEASEVRTRSWLKNVVISSTDRLMFLIEDESSRRIGHFGIANIEPDSLELDNGIRGEPGGHPKLFNYVELYVCHLAFQSLGVRVVKVRVFADNMSARRLHRAVGFVERGRENLVRKQVSENEFRYERDTGQDEAPDVRQQIHLEMSRRDFYTRYPWLEAVVLFAGELSKGN